MKRVTTLVVSVRAGSNEDLSKDGRQTIHAELDGIEVPGAISAGDEVTIETYETPPWLAWASG